jgi:pimeloyl-ACP methyl ester carboxylesterase
VSAYLLIHGGLHDSSCWEPVIEPLRNLGHYVAAIDLPGRGETAARAASTTLQDYIDCASAAVDAAPEPPIVVAHSVGGVTASALVESHPDALRGIVFVCAVVPVDGAAGLPTLQEIGPECALLREGAIIFADDSTTISVPPESARFAFYGRCSEASTALAVSHLVPEPLAPFLTPLTLGANFASVPKTYLGATHDATVPLAFQHVLAQRSGATFVELDSDHSPFYSATDELVARLAVADQGWRA